MRGHKYIKETRREFIRDKRKSLRKAKKVLDELRCGCALWDIFDGTNSFQVAVDTMQIAIDQMDEITRPLA